MSLFPVIRSSFHRPLSKAVVSPDPLSRGGLFSAARPVRRFAWPLRDREAFRRAGGCAVYPLRPSAADESWGRELWLDSAPADADLSRNTRCAQFGVSHWDSGRSERSAGRVANMARRPAGFGFFLPANRMARRHRTSGRAPRSPVQTEPCSRLPSPGEAPLAQQRACDRSAGTPA